MNFTSLHDYKYDSKFSVQYNYFVLYIKNLICFGNNLKDMQFPIIITY